MVPWRAYFGYMGLQGTIEGMYRVVTRVSYEEKLNIQGSSGLPPESFHGGLIGDETE
jgi:hypothetical protein